MCRSCRVGRKPVSRSLLGCRMPRAVRCRSAVAALARWTAALLLAAVLAVPAARASDLQLVEVRKIWDQAPHNAFTDLVRVGDRWYCVFREGKAHVSPDGALRVLTSADGEEWASAALLTSDTADLRDAKITVTPDGRLQLNGAAALHDKSKQRHQSSVWFSRDGKEWSEPIPVGDPDYWLWRATWHKETAYGIGYHTGGGTRDCRLYRSSDGKKWEVLVERLHDQGYPNEHALVFLEDDTCLCLLRRDGSPNTALLGSAQPPYTQWEWKDLGVRVGGPEMIRTADGRLLACVRLYDRQVRTALCWIDAEKGTLQEALTLPSAGDTSYAGIVPHDGLLWISYYSSHKTVEGNDGAPRAVPGGKTSIYLAKVRLLQPNAQPVPESPTPSPSDLPLEEQPADEQAAATDGEAVAEPSCCHQPACCRADGGLRRKCCKLGGRLRGGRCGRCGKGLLRRCR